MNRLFGVMLVLMLSGCGGLPASTSPSEDSGRRLVGGTGGFSVGGSDENAVDAAPAVDAVDATTDEPSGNPIRTDDSELADGDPGAAQDGTDMGGDDPLIDIPGGLPIDPFLPAPPDPVEPFDPLQFIPGMDPGLFGDFMPFFNDSLLLDALAPSPSSTRESFANSFSHLELLCLDLDLPRSYCRSRYGN